MSEYKDHKLTRAGMEAVIAEGGSVIYRGNIIKQVADLPTAAELAKGDPAQEQAATADIMAQLASLKEQLALLQPAEESDGGKNGGSGKGASTSNSQDGK